MITNDGGGIVDDCIITRDGPKSFYVVSNAGCADKVTTALKVITRLAFASNVRFT